MKAVDLVIGDHVKYIDVGKEIELLEDSISQAITTIREIGRTTHIRPHLKLYNFETNIMKFYLFNYRSKRKQRNKWGKKL